MKDQQTEPKVYYLFITIILTTSIVSGAIFLRLFAGKIDMQTIYLVLGIAILTLPISKFLLLTFFFSKFRRSYITVSLPIFNAVSTILLLLGYTGLVLLISEEFVENLDLVGIYLTIVSLFALSLSSTIVPFLLELTKKRESISKQVLISSAITSGALLGIVVIMGFVPSLSWVDQTIVAAVIISMLVISLKKSYGSLYKDLEVVNELLSLRKNEKENVITEEFHEIMAKLERIIFDQYSSSVSLIRSIKEIKNGLETIESEFRNTIPWFDEIRKELANTNVSIAGDIKTLDSIKTQTAEISSILLNIKKNLDNDHEVARNLEKIATEQLPKLNMVNSVALEVVEAISASIKSMKKSSEVLTSLSRLLPDIMEDFRFFNKTINTLRKITTRINAIRVSFDVELRKSEFDKQNKEKLGVISKKIDNLFLELQNSANSVFIDDEKFSIEAEFKRIMAKVSDVRSKVEEHLQHLQKFSFTTNDILNYLEKIRKFSGNVTEQYKKILEFYSSFSLLLQEATRVIESTITKLEEVTETVDGLISDCQEVENLVNKHVELVSKVDVKIPRFIEDIYGT